jgi:hypothetical protein
MSEDAFELKAPACEFEEWVMGTSFVSGKFGSPAANFNDR